MATIAQDQAERLLALDVTKSFIVQAPAGSGKTELLLQRFLMLLSCVNLPEEILAITFTKKAANEMRMRIITALKQAEANQEPDSAHAKATYLMAKKVLQRDKLLNWHLLENPNQLRIQTIDSFCAYLTRQLPLLSHFGAQPDICDTPLVLYREAVREVLMHVEQHYDWSQAIAQLLLHLDNDLNKLHDLMVNLLAKRDQWLPYIKLNTNDDEIKVQLELHLQHVICDTLQRIASIFPGEIIDDLLDVARYAASHVDNHHPLAQCRELTVLPNTQYQAKKIWQALASLLLTKSFTWRKRFDKDIGFLPLASFKNTNEKAQASLYRKKLSSLIESLQNHDNLAFALAELYFLPDGHYDDEQWKILQSMLQVLKILAAQLRVTFQQYGQIDFIENTQAALQALGNEDQPTDLALALDYQIKHILIDEFQDTSLTQYQLLAKLTLGFDGQDGRTLFVVGDPMQSIYRFREAEVGLFLRMRKNGINHIKLQPLTLSVNFRSKAAIVEWNNEHFAAIFPKFNDMANGAVKYSASTVLGEQASDAQINIIGCNDANTLQGDALVNIILETQRNYPQEKIAILVRSRSHLTDIIPLLKKAKLNFQAIDIDPLDSRQYIQDLLSLTCALIHPADRIAWLAILRAPWCGLTLNDLHVIASNNADATIWEQLLRADIFTQLSVDGQTRLRRLLPILKNQMLLRDRLDFRTWIENTWLQLGGPAVLQQETEMQDTDTFFQLLNDYQQHIDIDKLKEKITQCYANAQTENSNLQILTIHTAKGLEFDTVILPHLEKKMPSDDKSLMSWMERPLMNDQTALLLAPVHAIGQDKDMLYEYICRQQRIKSDYEIDRLLYVATTRAKQRLFLLFSADKKADDSYRIEAGSFLEKLWPQIKHNENMFASTSQNSIALTESSTRKIKRLQLTWQHPLSIKQPKHLSFHQQTEGFKLHKMRAVWIGIATHHILHMLSIHGKKWWQENSKAMQREFVQNHLRRLSMPRAQTITATQIVMQAIENTLNDARGQWILAQHMLAQSEYNLTALIDDRLETIVIDRTFIDEHGTRWIIDYKTSTFSTIELDEFLNREQDKYLAQMQKYQQALELDNENHPVRLGLFFPCIPAWKEWSL